MTLMLHLISYHSHNPSLQADNPYLFVDSLDQYIYDKMPKLLEQYEGYSLQKKKYKISVHTINNSFL